jgi:transposase-like protein
MPKRIFTKEQIRKLSRNRHVARCSATTVRYTREFRESAVRQYGEGMSALEIFRNAGIDPETIGMVSPNRLLHQWRSARRPSVQEAGPPAVARSELEGLRAEVAYLKEENRFLVRLRARGRDSGLRPVRSTPSSRVSAGMPSAFAESPESPGAATTNGGKRKANFPKTGKTTSSSRPSSRKERPGGAGGRSR